MKINKYTKAAVEAARIGGDVLRKFYNTPVRVEYKGIVDPVTIADKTSQSAVLKYLRREFSRHSFMAEEDSFDKVVCSDYCWIIDPLDGTVNFIHGLPFFCVSVALLHNGLVISGAVYAPLLNEMFVAQKNHGAWLNSCRIHVASNASLIKSLAITGFPYDIGKRPKKIFSRFNKAVEKTQAVRRLGSAALDLAYVACGRADAFWEEDLKPWDVAAGALFVSEAGGRVSDFLGGEDYIFNRNIIATNGLIHKKFLELLK